MAKRGGGGQYEEKGAGTKKRKAGNGDSQGGNEICEVAFRGAGGGGRMGLTRKNMGAPRENEGDAKGGTKRRAWGFRVKHLYHDHEQKKRNTGRSFTHNKRLKALTGKGVRVVKHEDTRGGNAEKTGPTGMALADDTTQH